MSAWAYICKIAVVRINKTEVRQKRIDNGRGQNSVGRASGGKENNRKRQRLAYENVVPGKKF